MAHVGYKLALCALLFFSGCISSGSFVLTEPPRGGFEPGAQVLIVNKGGDGLDIQDDLEHRMLRAGFQVRSELPQDVRLRLSDAEAKKGGRVNYAYRLDYEYHWRTTSVPF
jgi:hypothetical protein